MLEDMPFSLRASFSIKIRSSCDPLVGDKTERWTVKLENAHHNLVLLKCLDKLGVSCQVFTKSLLRSLEMEERVL